MRRSTRDPSPGRLWTSAAFISPTVTAAQALGHALKSPGLSGPPPWARGSIHQQLNPPADMSCTHGCSQWHGIKLHVTTLDNGRVPLRKIIEVHHGKLHQHRAERSAVGGTRKCVHRFTILLSVSDASGEQKGIELSATGYGSESVLVTLAWSAPIPVTPLACSPIDSVATGYHRVPHAVPRAPRLGAADRTGTHAESQRFTMVTRHTRRS